MSLEWACGEGIPALRKTLDFTVLPNTELPNPGMGFCLTEMPNAHFQVIPVNGECTAECHAYHRQKDRLTDTNGDEGVSAEQSYQNTAQLF